MSTWNKLMIFALSVNVKWGIFKLEYQLGYYPLCRKLCCLVPWMIIALVVSHYLRGSNE